MPLLNPFPVPYKDFGMKANGHFIMNRGTKMQEHFMSVWKFKKLFELDNRTDINSAEAKTMKESGFSFLIIGVPEGLNFDQVTAFQIKDLMQFYGV